MLGKSKVAGFALFKVYISTYIFVPCEHLQFNGFRQVSFYFLPLILFLGWESARMLLLHF